MNTEKTYSIAEIKNTFFPKSILTRMEDELMKRNRLKYPWQHLKVLDEDDPRCGTIEIAKKGYENTESLESWLISFYKRENYEVFQEDENVVENKDGERFKFTILESNTSIAISVRAVT